VLVTPSNHRVHHAQNEIYIDKNYGGILIVWDRLFGTFQAERDEEPVVFGVRKPLANWNPFWANLQVYDYLWFDAVRARRWRDKFGVWFRRTGWRPADVEEKFPKQSADLTRFEKFDPPLGPNTRRYVILQFIVAAAGVLWIGNLYATQGAVAVLLPCGLLWATLYGLGLVSEGRSYARGVEWFRLLCIMPAGTWSLLQAGTIAEQRAGSAWLWLAAYIVVSGLTLTLSARDEQIMESINTD
jgi:hypothetical protein